jgi:hypothetical protein
VKVVLAQTILKMRFAELDESLDLLVSQLLALSPEEFVELLAQWSQLSDEVLWERLEGRS